MFDEQRAEQICARLSQEPISLQAVLRDGGPSSSELYRWLEQVPSFRESYARAREAQADVDADTIADVRAQMLAGAITPEQARVAIDSLKWSAGKRKPKVYGDRVQVDADLRMQVTVDDPTIRAQVIAQQSVPKLATDHSTDGE
jgi:phage-related minor tail protein